MNHYELKEKVISACNQLIKEKGYIAPVDVLLKIEKVDKKQYLNWKAGKVPYLEKVCNTNLSKLNLILKTIENYGKERQLKPSFTYYKRQGKKTKLQFSKNNTDYLENKYATHYVDTVILND